MQFRSLLDNYIVPEHSKEMGASKNSKFSVCIGPFPDCHVAAIELLPSSNLVPSSRNIQLAGSLTYLISAEVGYGKHWWMVSINGQVDMIRPSLRQDPLFTVATNFASCSAWINPK